MRDLIGINEVTQNGIKWSDYRDAKKKMRKMLLSRYYQSVTTDLIYYNHIIITIMKLPQ